ncbi:MAG: aspartate aminotransferase family protein [Bdellovibrionaceae bacterium]|nr:aspartate aminotransferase family protein [Pseudobdellovibrionaceae bacterium]
MDKRTEPNQSLSNEELIAFRKKHFLPTAALYHAKPIHLVKGQGKYVWDSEGKRYLDAIGGIVCISAGHNHPRIKAALMKMLEEDGIQHTSTLYLSQYTVDAARVLLAESLNTLDRVSFTNSGSEANELALMAARHATGETMVVNLRHSYHGGTSATLASCGHSSWRFRAQPVANTTSALEPNCYRCPFGKKADSCSLECAQNVEATIQTSTHGKIAALIAEPVMGVGGFICPPDEYFKKIVKIAHDYGGKYISDEVQTGAGRCGESFFLTKSMGLDADMITMAKGFGNGAAIGAVLMKTEISETMAGKSYFNTFGGDPFQVLQAKLTMDIIREEKLIENAKNMGTLLRDGLLQLMKTHSLIGDVRGRGLLMGMEFVKDRATKIHAPQEVAGFMDACLARGLLVGKGGLMGNVVRIAPPLSINKEQVDFMLETFDQALFEIGWKKWN